MRNRCVGWLLLSLAACTSRAPDEAPSDGCLDCRKATSGTQSAALLAPSAEVDTACNDGQAQQFGDLVLGVEAERYTTSVGSPSKVDEDSAYGRKAVKFMTNADQVNVPVTFREIGQYRLLIRARGFNTSSDSVFVSDTYDASSTANFGVNFGRQDATFFWLDTSVTYNVTADKLHRSWTVPLRRRETNAEIDAIALVKVGSGASADTPFIHTQAASTNVFGFPAERADSINDPDADTRVFVRSDGGIAQGWQVLRAPAVAAGSAETIARYRVRFATAGTYSLHLRGRGQATSADSVFAPTAFATPPAVSVGFPTGAFGWRTAIGLDSFVVAAADVGKVLDLEIGSREHETELDSIAFVRQGTTATEALLDASLGHFEAENAGLAGIVLVDHATASGGKRASGFGEIGDRIDFGQLAVENRLYVRYSLERTLGKQASVYVNGVDVGTVHFTSTGSWDTYATTFVYLPAPGLVRLQIDADDYAMNLGSVSASIDRVSLSEGPAPCILNQEDDVAVLLRSPKAGDTYVLPSGTHSTLPSLAIGDGTPAHDGSHDRPITLRAQTAGKALLNNRQTVSLNARYAVVDGLTFSGSIASSGILNMNDDCRHCRFTNNTIEGGSELGSGAWVELDGYHGRVDHNHFVGKTRAGVVIANEHGNRAQSYHVIDSNYFGTRPADPNNGNGWETIRTGLSTDALYPASLTVKRNLFFKNDGEFGGEIISNKSGDNYYFYNTFQESAGGLVLRQGDGVRVEGNVFLGTAGVSGRNYLGVRVHSTNHVIVNNHFQNVDRAIEIGLGQAGLSADAANRYCYWPVTDVLIAHNTTVNVASPALTLEDMDPCEGIDSNVPPQRLFVVNNFVKDAVFSTAQPNTGDIRYFNNETGSASHPGAGWTVASWSFALDSRGLLRPTVAHPGKPQNQWPSGFPLHALRADVDGQALDSQPDIGADDVVAGGTSNTRPPLKFADVGPRWGVRSLVP